MLVATFNRRESVTSSNDPITSKKFNDATLIYSISEPHAPVSSRCRSPSSCKPLEKNVSDTQEWAHWLKLSSVQWKSMRFFVNWLLNQILTLIKFPLEETLKWKNSEILKYNRIRKNLNFKFSKKNTLKFLTKVNCHFNHFGISIWC